mgnify:CR=1 FL=1
MIKSFAHKGLEKFFREGAKKGVRPEHALRLADTLDRLHASQDVRDMDFPGARLHQLRGKMKGFWSVTISGNWRVVFEFEDGHAFKVGYVDYH